MGKWRSAILTAMFVGLGCAGSFAADVDLDDGNNIGRGTIGEDYYIYNSNGNNNNITNPNTSDTITINADNYTIGASEHGASTGKVNIELGRLNLNNKVLNIVNSQKSGQEGTIFTLSDRLVANDGGTINIGDSVSDSSGRYNLLTTDQFIANGSADTETYINIGANSLLHVEKHAVLGSSSDLNGSVTIALGSAAGKGYMIFRNGMTLLNGSITGTGKITGKVTLSGATAAAATALADAGDNLEFDDIDNTMGTIGAQSGTTGGAQLTAKNITQDGGELRVGANGGYNAIMNVTGDLTINGGTASITANADSSAYLNVDGAMTVETNNMIIKGSTSNSDVAIVSAGSLNVDSTGTAIDIGENGKLVTGSVGSTATDTITNGSLIANASAQAVFNNTVEMKNASEIAATGADSVVAFNNAVSTDGTSRIVAENGGKVYFGNALNMSGSSYVEMNNGGTVDISRLSTIDGGSFKAEGAAENFAIVGNGIKASTANAFTVGNGATLSLTQVDMAGAAYGDLYADANESINLDANSTMNVGTLYVTENVNDDLFAGGAPNSTFNANNFLVMQGANVNGSTQVEMNIKNNAQIAGTYTAVNGNTNFNMGLQVVNGGVLDAAKGNATVSIGTTSDAADVQVFNGTLGNGSISAGSLTLSNVNASDKANLKFGGDSNKIMGAVTANGGGGFGIIVDGDLELVENAFKDTILTGTSYTQTSGAVSSDTASNQKIVTTDNTELATISGRNSSFSVNGDFAGGVSFLNGATLVSNGNTNAIVNTGGGGKDFYLDASSTLDLSKGSITIGNFDNLTIAGTMILGADSTQVFRINNGTATVTTSDLSKIQLTSSFVKNYTTTGSYHHWIYQDKPMIGDAKTAEHTTSNVFGDFTFKYEEGQGAWIDSVDAKNVRNVVGVRESLTQHWDRKPSSWGFSTNVSKVAENIKHGGGAYSNGSKTGDLNYAILEAFTLGGPGYAFSSGSVSGYLDNGLLSAYNGAAATGVIFTSQDVTREIMTTLHARVADIRTIQNYVATDSAFASMTTAEALNNQYLNRFWAGGLGMWQNADKRKEFAGYDFDGYGAILGYDRAFGSVIGGLSVAYLEGDYKDKSASAHDSKIKNYAADAYLTYSACSGFFATIMGGYNYSDNDIRERRGGMWATEDYHTQTWHASGKLGYDFAPSDNLTVSPAVGANFYYSRSNSHDMNVAGSSLLRYSGMRNHNVEIPVEVRMAYNINLADDRDLILLANGGYAYNLNDHGVTGNVDTNGLLGAVSMRAVGRKLGHHSWVAGAGAKLRHGQFDLGVKYDYMGRGKSDNHRVMGTVGFSF